MIQGLRTVIYYVPDLAAAKVWYSAMLEKEPYFDEPFYVGYNVGGFELGLHPGEGVTRGANVVAYWGVPDAHKAFAHITALGGQVQQPVADVGEGILAGAVTDPFGNVFGIIENPNFKPGKSE